MDIDKPSVPNNGTNSNHNWAVIIAPNFQDAMIIDGEAYSLKRCAIVRYKKKGSDWKTSKLIKQKRDSDFTESERLMLDNDMPNAGTFAYRAKATYINKDITDPSKRKQRVQSDLSSEVTF